MPQVAGTRPPWTLKSRRVDAKSGAIKVGSRSNLRSSPCVEGRSAALGALQTRGGLVAAQRRRWLSCVLRALPMPQRRSRVGHATCSKTYFLPQMTQLTRLVLGADPECRTIDGLLCGPARLLRATPVGENEVAGLDPGEPWDETAARAALARRPAGGSRAEKSASCPFVGGVRARRARSGATMNVGDRTQAPVGRCRQPDPARHEQLPPNSGTPRTALTSATRIRSGRS